MGTSTVFYMMEQFDNMGVPEHFPICGIFVGIFVLLYFGIFVWDFLWWGFYMVPLAYDNGMGPRYWERESRHRVTPLMFA